MFTPALLDKLKDLVRNIPDMYIEEDQKVSIWIICPAYKSEGKGHTYDSLFRGTVNEFLECTIDGDFLYWKGVNDSYTRSNITGVTSINLDLECPEYCMDDIVIFDDHEIRYTEESLGQVLTRSTLIENRITYNLK